jgi:hypothetical protein
MDSVEESNDLLAFAPRASSLNSGALCVKGGALCILGRGIEQVKTNRQSVWRPTRYIELLAEVGTHTGKRFRGLTIDDSSAVIAGSNANTLAAIELFTTCRTARKVPKLVIFAAGRPDYLANESDKELTEGRILAERFVRGARPRPDETRIVVLKNNRDTRDDIAETLKLVLSAGLRELIVLTVSVHIPRASEMVRMLPVPGVDIQFISAEELLACRYRCRKWPSRLLERLSSTEAYRRTAEREERGLLALRSGTYGR